MDDHGPVKTILLKYLNNNNYIIKLVLLTKSVTRSIIATYILSNFLVKMLNYVLRLGRSTVPRYLYDRYPVSKFMDRTTLFKISKGKADNASLYSFDVIF